MYIVVENPIIKKEVFLSRWINVCHAATNSDRVKIDFVSVSTFYRRLVSLNRNNSYCLKILFTWYIKLPEVCRKIDLFHFFAGVGVGGGSRTVTTWMQKIKYRMLFVYIKLFIYGSSTISSDLRIFKTFLRSLSDLPFLSPIIIVFRWYNIHQISSSEMK